MPACPLHETCPYDLANWLFGMPIWGEIPAAHPLLFDKPNAFNNEPHP